mmetsp:Transcript_17835/g.21857  ORF Transcript_17835/g.21857 Transcript_17835/m.21857 type:complete len:379 (-) Transcript_17835:476-1612(-)
MDPCRNLILEQVEVLLMKEPGRKSLYDLLKVTSPNLEESSLDDSILRAKSYKKLKLRIHPDKHNNDSRATNIFQNLNSFYNTCVSTILNDRKLGSQQRGKKEFQKCPSKTSTSGPLEFDVRDKWSFLHLRLKNCEAKYIPQQVAYQCMNARGAIAHCRKTQCSYKIKESCSVHNVEEVFHKNGGSRNFEDIDDIKHELMTKGPVVSTSFLLSKTFMNKCEKSFWFDKSLIGKEYPLLIIGWKMTSFGEVWLVQPLTRNGSSEIQRVAFGQFGIDDHCIAPLSTFENTPWQAGPYFDISFPGTTEWHTWTGIKIGIRSNELENLGKVLGEDLMMMPRAKKKFVIRSKTKHAHSRAGYLKTLERQTDEFPWRIEITFLDD